jgi:hypothetical protein
VADEIASRPAAVQPAAARDTAAAVEATRMPRFGLSGRLLLLTVLFVMLAEVLIYVPSVANFRRNWLNDRLAAAQMAALVLDAVPGERLPEDLERGSSWGLERRQSRSSAPGRGGFSR